MEKIVQFSLGDMDLRFFDDNRSRTVGIIAQEIAVGDYGIERMVLNPDDIVIDIGANIGMFSVFVAKLQPLARIYAFEPVVSNYLRLCSNLTANRIKNVWPFNFGIFPEPSFEIGVLSENHGASSEFIQDRNFTQICRSIPIQDLRSHLGITNAKWLKIDCEGCEKYMTNADLSFAEYLSVELHPSACDANALVKKFQSSHGDKFWFKMAT